MKLKRALLVIGLIIVIGIGVYFVTQNTPAKKNDRILWGLLNEFSDAISNLSQAEIVETKGICGKLYGNGNGMQYFGAVLVKQDSIKDMTALLEQLDQMFEIVAVTAQEDNEIKTKYLGHHSLSFETTMPDGTQYICIYFFNSHHPDSNPYDIRGH